MKTIVALLKWLFGPEPESPPPAKKPYVCGWQRAHSRRFQFRNIEERATMLTPAEMRAEDQRRGLPWFPEDIQ